MNGTPLHTPRWHRILVRTCYTFNFFAIALAIVTLGVVGWVMKRFRIEMREWVSAQERPRHACFVRKRRRMNSMSRSAF